MVKSLKPVVRVLNAAAVLDLSREFAKNVWEATQKLEEPWL